jgi:hypothetical protein
MRSTARWKNPIPALVGSVAALGLIACDSSDPVSVGGPPAVPTGVYTITGDQQVEVRWNPVRGNNVQGYGVYRSDTIDGAYVDQQKVYGEESSSYVDRNVTNGQTYFYAVDAFNFANQESALSYEDAFDTPRPAGAGTLSAKEVDPALAGIDWSAQPNFVRAFDFSETDIFVQRIDGVLYAKGRVGTSGFWNDLQDLGWTASMDDISWAPSDGWSVSPNGVELIVGHTYVVWTHDEHFAKFRVKAITVDGAQVPTSIQFDWAYQIDAQNPELLAPFVASREAGSPARGDA